MSFRITYPEKRALLIFKIRPCAVRSDLKIRHFSADFVLIFKIRSYSARSDLKNRSARFSGECLRVALRNPPAWHRGLPGPSGPEPQKSPKRVHKGVPGPPAPESPKVPKECAPESEKNVKKVRSCVFGLFSDSGAYSLGTVGLPGPEAPGHPFGLVSDSFGVAGPKGPGALCARPGGSQGCTSTEQSWHWVNFFQNYRVTRNCYITAICFLESTSALHDILFTASIFI